MTENIVLNSYQIGLFHLRLFSFESFNFVVCVGILTIQTQSKLILMFTYLAFQAIIPLTLPASILGRKTQSKIFNLS